MSQILIENKLIWSYSVHLNLTEEDHNRVEAVIFSCTSTIRVKIWNILSCEMRIISCSANLRHIHFLFYISCFLFSLRYLQAMIIPLAIWPGSTGYIFFFYKNNYIYWLFRHLFIICKSKNKLINFAVFSIIQTTSKNTAPMGSERLPLLAQNSFIMSPFEFLFHSTNNSLHYCL